MAIKFQYNKTALQSLNKQLNIRLRALPTLKNKEATLRLEVKKAKDKTIELKNELEKKLELKAESFGLWNEFMPTLIGISDVEISSKKIAGLIVPVLENVIFREEEYSLFDKPKWYPEGITFLKEIVSIGLEIEFFKRKMELLNYARRKTTQKVNLYEKVQIPEFEDAVRKIKRFLEDEDNLSKSAQKIVKKRQQRQREGMA